MTKYFRFFILIAVTIAIAFFLFKKEDPKPNIVETPKTPIQNSEPKIDNKKVVGLTPGKEEEELKDLKIDNAVSETWKTNLEKNLMEQGGDAIKSISIKKVDSFIWKKDAVALHVESVIVSLKDQQNSESSFRAMVDAQTGKILQTWDQPVFDPASPKDNYKIRIDPRYHNP